MSFCRPPQNALTTDLFRELDVVLDELEADHALRALIITGTGRFFSSGVDPHILAADDQSALAELLTVGRRVLQRIERSPRPIIAAVNGHAFGGGLEIALACHFRILDHGALVGLTESNLGLIPGLDGIERLVALVGRGRALDYLIFGKLLTATTAATIGLASRVSQRNRALDDAGALAAELSERSQTATRLLLDAVHHVQGSTQALDRRANEACLESARSEEARQAVRRLLAAPSEIERDPSHGERAE